MRAPTQLDSDEHILVLAIRRGQYEIARELLKAGANVEARTGFMGRSPLMIACGKPVDSDSNIDHYMPKMVDLILRYKPNVNYSLANGDTALLLATFYVRVEAVQTLLAEGADIDATDQNGDTALAYVCKEHWAHVDPAHYLIIGDLLLGRSANVTRANNRKEIPLMHAAKNNHGSMVQKLIDRDATTVSYARLPTSETALFYGVYHGSAESVGILLRHGADLSWRSSSNKTPYANNQQALISLQAAERNEPDIKAQALAWYAKERVERESHQRKQANAQLKDRLERTQQVICNFRNSLKSMVIHSVLPLALGDILVDYIQLDPDAIELAHDIADAALGNDVPRIKNYLDAGGNIKARTKGQKGKTMLELARENQSAAVVEYLSGEYIKRNIDLKATENSPPLPVSASAPHA